MMTTKAKLVVDAPLPVEARLTLLREDLTRTTRSAMYKIDVTAVPDGEEWVINRDGIILNGTKYHRGDKVKLSPPDAKRLYSHNYITTVDAWEASQKAAKARKFLGDVVFPLETPLAEYKRNEAEAIDRVARLEHDLIQARHAIETARIQRQAMQDRIAKLIDEYEAMTSNGAGQQ